MTKYIYSQYTASISDLKKNPTEIALSGKGHPVAIFNRNNPVFYCVPAELFERMFETIENHQFAKRAVETEHDDKIEVSPDGLHAFLHNQLPKKAEKI